MGTVIHFRASSRYKSGRSSWGGMPVSRETAKTRKGGTSRQADMACLVRPSSEASRVLPPTAAAARSTRSLMAAKSNTVLQASQQAFDCVGQCHLYNGAMTLGARIRAARKRQKMTQDKLAEVLGVTKQGVSAWERDIAKPDLENAMALRCALKVTYSWLIEGVGVLSDDPGGEPTLHGLSAAEQAAVYSLINALRAQRSSAA